MITQANELDFSGVEETALLTVYSRVIESRSQNPILKDEKAEALVEKLDELLQKRNGEMAKLLFSRSIDPKLSVHIPLRALKYDDYVRAFLQNHPDGVVVNIGCGMDTRFFRVDNGKVNFFDVDLPEMIRVKKQLIAESSRYKMIGESVLEMDWMDQILVLGKPVIFLAEGVFMYLAEENVKALVLEMQKRFPGSELVCELTNRTWVNGFWGKVTAMKMKKKFKMGSDAGFKFGVSDAREFETWHKGIEFLDQWFYMDSNHPKLGWIRTLRHFEFFRNAQFSAHYRLNAP
jgi:methyltransferase (TIGR00027 family)